MMRALILALTLFAGPVAARDWSVSLIVADGPSHELSGSLNAIYSAPGRNEYMSSEVFADGVDARGIDCASADYFEVDYFFGRDGDFGGHILFGLETSGPVPQPVEPALFYDEMNRRDEIVRSYAGFDEMSIRIDGFECVGGTPVLSITYKGTVYLEYGEGPDRLVVTGTADAEMILKDMNEY